MHLSVVCAQNFIDHPAIIGGPGVKIDESKFGKGKYNRGRMVDDTGCWRNVTVTSYAAGLPCPTKLLVHPLPLLIEVN